MSVSQLGRYSICMSGSVLGRNYVCPYLCLVGILYVRICVGYVFCMSVSELITNRKPYIKNPKVTAILTLAPMSRSIKRLFVLNRLKAFEMH